MDRPTPRTSGNTYMHRLPIKAIQLEAPITFKGRDWPAGSWICYDPATEREFVMSNEKFQRAFLYLLNKHS